MIEVTIDSVRVNLMSPQRLVILREVGADRYLPIWVGPYEAEAITVALQEVEIVRPLTHDLLKNVFTTFNARIKRIEIVSLKEDIFYGNIVAEVSPGSGSSCPAGSPYAMPHVAMPRRTDPRSPERSTSP